jgi:hypothetical protein
VPAAKRTKFNSSLCEKRKNRFSLNNVSFCEFTRGRNFTSGTNPDLPCCLLVEAPVSGAFVVGIAMLETADFFQDQIQQCRKLAAAAHDKTDREFWLRLAHRWEGLLLARRQDGASLEKIQKLRPVRPIFAKRRSAA